MEGGSSSSKVIFSLDLHVDDGVDDDIDIGSSDGSVLDINDGVGSICSAVCTTSSTFSMDPIFFLS